MSTVRAFVGHSFTKEDEVLFRRFEDHFNDLERIQPAFRWDHAQLAQPISVSEKVLKLAADKSVFVAICTRKERVLKSSVLPSIVGRLFLGESDFAWKTSDWIIQETGLARGLKLHSIIFVEDGVRPPGGLLSDLEYIQFNRDNPEPSFGKFMQMIAALIADPSAGPTTTPEAAAPTTLSSTPREDADVPPPSPLGIGFADPVEPQADWTLDKYNLANLYVIAEERGNDAEQKLTDSFAASPHASEPNAMSEWRALMEANRIHWAKGGQLDVLRKFRTDVPQSANIARLMARALEKFDRFDDAAKEYEAAATLSQEAPRKVKNLLAASNALRKAGNQEDARKYDAAARAATVGNLAAEREYLITWREFEKRATAQHGPALAGALERLLTIDPTNGDWRFDLAYQYDELGERELALYHYDLISRADRGSGAWNNLGNSQRALGMPAKAVESFRESNKLGETLAASNLASMYLDAGFLDEAKKLCETAQKSGNPHKNVLTTLARVHDVPEEEEAEDKKIKNAARQKSSFYSGFGRSMARPKPSDLEQTWQGPDCLLNVKIMGDVFSAVGEYDEKPSGLINALTRSYGGVTPPEKMEVRFVGAMSGCSVSGSIRKKRKSDPDQPRIIGDSATEVLMFIDEGMRRIHVLEKSKSGDTRYELVKNE